LKKCWHSLNNLKKPNYRNSDFEILCTFIQQVHQIYLEVIKRQLARI